MPVSVPEIVETDKTRVATFMMAKEVSMRTYNQIGVSDAFHPL